ncbi:MAG: DUF5134 domain-containing protein [Kibdelosporangium sp.]
MRDTVMTLGPVYLRWWLVTVFALPGLFFTVRCVSQGSVNERIGDLLHVLMCAGMIAMVLPAVPGIPLIGQIVVFSAGTLWFTGLIFVEHGTRHWHRTSGAHAHHAIMMAGMVWMTTIMAMAGDDAAVPFVLTVIAAVLAVLFLVSAGNAVLLTSRTTPEHRVPLSVAADVIMTAGMAATTLVMIT